MTVSTTRARHRAARRPVTPLSTIAQAGVLPRRTPVVRPAPAGGVTAQGEGAPVVLDLPDDVARHLFVARG